MIEESQPFPKPALELGVRHLDADATAIAQRRDGIGVDRLS
jgi:hypothetical protein